MSLCLNGAKENISLPRNLCLGYQRAVDIFLAFARVFSVVFLVTRRSLSYRETHW